MGHRMGNRRLTRRRASGNVNMLNLDAIFDPDRKPGVLATAEPGSAVAGTADSGLRCCIITGPGDLPGDWRCEFEERASIREYAGGQTREYAEAAAFSEIVARMRAAGEST